MVRDLLDRWDLGDLVGDATVVVSELVANAIEHAQSECVVAVSRSSTGVRIEVRDQGEGTPDVRPLDRQSERGRGLRIISSLSTAWGVSSDDRSKTVWAELSAPADA
jgi:anti-sigma regulatory factor (Ser/Thr protein kinase)